MTEQSRDDFSLEGWHHFQLLIPPGAEPAARKFYGGALEMTEVDKPATLASRGGTWFRGPGMELHLGVDDDFRPERKGHPGFLVDGLERLAARLEAEGHELRWDRDFPGYRRFYVHDPFGNRLEFLEPERG